MEGEAESEEEERRRQGDREGAGGSRIVCMDLSGKVSVLDLICTKTIQDTRQQTERRQGVHLETDDRHSRHHVYCIKRAIRSP